MNNELIEHPSWWKRNWKWALPVGGCLTLIVLFIALIGAGIFGVSKMFTGSEPYTYALEQVQSNEQVIELLGEPIETNGIMQGSINFSNNEGNANISIPIKGPNGEGKIYVVGEKRNDTWTYSELEVRINENNEVINLLDEGLHEIKEASDF
jgi:hypothetical protein